MGIYKRRICPWCKSKETARVVYGDGYHSAELRAQRESGEIIDGGYCTPYGAGTHFCEACRKGFGGQTFPNDIVALDFSFGSSSQGHDIISIRVQDDEREAIWHKSCNSAACSETEYKVIPRSEWEPLASAITFWVWDWDKSYSGEATLDNSVWKLIIIWGNGRKRIYSGHNAYPQHWELFLCDLGSIGFTCITTASNYG